MENNQEQTEQVEETEDAQEEQENITYTQSEVDRQISKAVENALEKNRAKWEKEKQEQIEKERNEAAEYAKLTQKEKEEADYKKRLEELEKRERELNNRQLASQIESDLRENNLPVAFTDSLLAIQDNEKIKEAISDIKKEFVDAINTQVKDALRQDTPKASHTKVEEPKNITNYSVSELIKLKKENPELYNSLERQ